MSLPGFFYREYDSDGLHSTKQVSKQIMTVEEFKIERGYKAGIWHHPKNVFHIQTYKVEIGIVVDKCLEWKTLCEDDTIDFSNKPLIHVKLVHI